MVVVGSKSANGIFDNARDSDDKSKVVVIR